MAGHSKWNNIKRTKEKVDAARGKIFTKIVREISVAVKQGGGPDPSLNNRLRDAISKAKQSNMPADSIQRAIKKASGELDSVNYDEVNYEGYGVGGIAVIVCCLTDNRNRTASDVRHAFDKYGGSLGQTGSVGFLFERKGIFVLEKSQHNYDELFEFVIENDCEDLEELEESFVISCSPEKYSYVLKACEQNNFNLVNSEIEFVPNSYLALDEQQQKMFEKMVSQLEDLDDVASVYHNAELN